MNKYIYVSFLFSDDFLENIIYLHYSYLKINSKYPFLVLYIDKVSQQSLDKLTALGIKHQLVPTNYDSPDNWDVNITSVFNLTEYDKIIYISKNYIFLKNTDFIFDLKGFPFFWEWPLKQAKKIKTFWFCCVPDQTVYQLAQNDYNIIHNSEEELYKLFIKDKIKYSHTIMRYPAFVNYWYYLTKDDLQSFDKEENVQLNLEKILNNKEKILQYKYLYYTMVPKYN